MVGQRAERRQDKSGFGDDRRWNGAVDAVFAPSSGRTVLRSLDFYGPLRIQSLFYPEAGEGVQCSHCYLLHPPGGLVSGDCLSVGISCHDGARSLVTTPAMTKVYMADSHRVRQSESISLKAERSDLEWLPQGVIFFDGSEAQFSLDAQLDDESSLFALSLNVFGRKEGAADYVGARCVLKAAIARCGAPLLSERMELSPGCLALRSPASLSGFGVCGSLYAVARPEDEGALEEAVLKLAPSFARFDGRCMAGISFANHVAAARVLCQGSEEAFSILSGAWEALRPAVSGRKAVRPRIWAT
ncbi:MAG: urease accessory protein UreD [Succinivibrio sp.]